MDADVQVKLGIALAVVLFTSVVAFFVFFKSGGRAAKRADSSVKFLNRERQKAPLKEIVRLSHDTKMFRFELPQGTCLGLPTGKHIKVFATNPNIGGKQAWNGKDAEIDEEIERKYTPTSSDADEGRFDLVIKVYRPNDKFSHGGKVSQFMDTLQIGDSLDFSGPWGMIEYKGNGLFKKGSKDIPVKAIGMIAGGTGITPMLQVIEAVLSDPDDKTMISLIFANQTEEDILVRSRLLELVGERHEQFKVHFTLDRPPQGWQGSTGFVTKEMIASNLPPASNDVVILLCGPPPMIKFACKPNLESLGYAAERVLEF